MNSKSKEILTKNVKKERINVIFYNIKNCTDQCSVTILFDLKDDALY